MVYLHSILLKCKAIFGILYNLWKFYDVLILVDRVISTKTIHLKFMTTHRFDFKLRDWNLLHSLKDSILDNMSISIIEKLG